ncbi:hypothetical protein D1007_12301 [Hordeum vulgare]|nr:hypothetical protein D1007_12301 [Hordeum vulgare]
MAEAEAADAAAWEAAHADAICARISKKRQRRNTRGLARKKNLAVREMVGLPPKEEKEVSGNEDTSSDEYIRLDPYRVFNCFVPESVRGYNDGSLYVRNGARFYSHASCQSGRARGLVNEWWVIRIITCDRDALSRTNGRAGLVVRVLSM